MNINSNGSLLMTMQETSKVLGVPKKAVQMMVSSGSLVGVDVGSATYITRQSLSGLLGQNEQVNFGQQMRGYLGAEELSSVLTNNQLVNTSEKVVTSMTYKGSVSSLSDGRFMVQIDKGKKADGKRDRENKSFRNKEDADKYLATRLAELNTPIVAAPTTAAPIVTPHYSPTAPMPQGNYTSLTFEEYATKVLNNGIGKATSRTIEGYRRGLTSVVPIIGKKLMTEITNQDLRKVFEKIRYKYADSNIKRSFGITRLVFQTAFDNADIPSDPMNKLKRPSSKKPVEKEEYATYSDADIKVLFDTSKRYSIELHCMLTIMECTGMRPGELRALEWSKFNAKEKTIFINQAITEEFEEIKDIRKAPKSREILSVTKTVYGVRTLPLSDVAVDALLAWQKQLRKSRNKLKANSTFIFPTHDGSYKSESSIQSMIQRYRERCQIAEMGVTFYKFRHTMCTRLILANQPIPVIQRILGDNTTDVIMKIYTHVTEKMALQAAKGFYEDMNKRHAGISS